MKSDTFENHQLWPWQVYHLAPIFIYTPTTSQQRMKYINEFAQGFIYCIARSGEFLEWWPGIRELLEDARR